MPDTPTTAQPSKPRRRWFQFRLRTLLIVIMMLAILLPIALWLDREWQELRDLDRFILKGGPRHFLL